MILLKTEVKLLMNKTNSESKKRKRVSDVNKHIIEPETPVKESLDTIAEENKENKENSIKIHEVSNKKRNSSNRKKPNKKTQENSQKKDISEEKIDRIEEELKNMQVIIENPNENMEEEHLKLKIDIKNTTKSEKKEDSNQKKLLNFFQKKQPSNIEEVKIKQKIGLFRSIGNFSSNNNTQINQDDNFWELLSLQNYKLDLSSIISEITEKYGVFRKKKRSVKIRKVFLFFSDSERQTKILSIYKNRKFIHGRNPLFKDPELDYQIDSDEELEEKDAEDLGSNENDQDDENENEEFSEPSFIVPDGYLSDQERNLSEDNVLENKQNCQIYTNSKPDRAQQYFIDLRNFEKGNDATLDAFMEEFGFLNLAKEG